jgi:hypothetical protein
MCEMGDGRMTDMIPLLLFGPFVSPRTGTSHEESHHNPFSPPADCQIVRPHMSSTPIPQNQLAFGIGMLK